MFPKFVLGFGTALALVACGSSSQVQSSKPNDSGVTTGGSAGSGGSGAGGAPNTAGDAASSGGAATSGGARGTLPDGSLGGDGSIPGSGGSAGSDGGNPGGATGTGGTAGVDGGATTPRCRPLCTEFTAANCTSGPTLAGCLLTCRALTSSAACDTKANAYFDCADGTTIQCNANGEPVAQGCGVQYLQAIACAVSEKPNPSIVTPCNDYCDKVVAAGCPNNAAKPECTTNCLWAGATGTGCDDEWHAYLDCANAAQFSCVLGFAVAQGCGTLFRAYSRCINAAGMP